MGNHRDCDTVLCFTFLHVRFQNILVDSEDYCTYIEGATNTGNGSRKSHFCLFREKSTPLDCNHNMIIQRKHSETLKLDS